MATYVQNLTTRRDAVAAQIASISASNYDLPNANGHSPGIDYVGKINALYDELDRLDAMIARADGSWELPVEYDT